MTRQITCPAGHAWEVADSPSPAGDTCPQCGRPAEVTDTASLLNVDEFPPLPESLVMPVMAGGRKAKPVSEPAPPRIEGYEIIGIIGRGGMGVVYRARQLRLNRVVALKLLRAGHGARPEEIDRFRLEAEAAARLQHPNIVQIFDVDDHEGHLYCVLEFVEGGTLAEKIAGKPQPVRESAELIALLADAIEAAHQRGILHRDLKPANVLLTESGRPKIADFGLAKRLDDDSGPTMSGAILGTPAYMAPEQAQGKTKEIGRASDLYSLGAILYELLTGRPPFRAGSALEMLRLVVSEPPIPPRSLQAEVPEELSRICLKCLSKSPADRYASGAALAQELRKFLGEGDKRPEPATAEPRRSSWQWTALQILILLVIAMIGIAFAPGWFGWDRPIADPGPQTPRDPTPPKPKPPEKPTPAEKKPEVKPPANPEPKETIPVKPVVSDATPDKWQVVANVDSQESGFQRVAFPSAMVGYVAGKQKLYKSEDSGEHWHPLPGEIEPKLLVWQFVDDRRGWLGRNELRQTTDGGASWQKVELPEPGVSFVYAIDMGTKELRLIAGRSAAGEFNMFRQRNAEETWQRIDPQSAKLWGMDDAYRTWYPRDIAVVSDQVALITLFAGESEASVVLRTDNAGDSWTVALDKIEDARFLGMTTSGRGWLTGSAGAIWETDDAGRNWRSAIAPMDRGEGFRSLTVSSNGDFGLAALEDGSVMELLPSGKWETTWTKFGLGKELADACVLPGRIGYVLGIDGRLARYRP